MYWHKKWTDEGCCTYYISWVDQVAATSSSEIDCSSHFSPLTSLTFAVLSAELIVVGPQGMRSRRSNWNKKIWVDYFAIIGKRFCRTQIIKTHNRKLLIEVVSSLLTSFQSLFEEYCKDNNSSWNDLWNGTVQVSLNRERIKMYGQSISSSTILQSVF